LLGPWHLEEHTAAEHPGWTATYQLLQSYPNQRQRVVPPQGCPLLGVNLGHGPSWLPPRRLVASGPQVPVHPAAPELELIDLALAEVFALGLKAQWDLEGRRPGAPPCVRSTEDAVAAFTASQYRQSG